MHTDHTACYAAVQAKDPRFDGWFVTAVRTTGIYCRPSCPARTPHARNVEFHATAAGAQAAGFRACKRCRPDASPGSPEWDSRSDVTARAVRLIADGVVDREGVPGLAARLGYSRRQLERLLAAELGAGPLGLARAQRAQTARTLLETTDLPVADIAYAAGFGSVRQFNDTVQDVFATTPTGLRGRRTRGTRGTVTLRLPFRQPLTPDNLYGHLVATGVPGVEEWRDGAYRRTLRLPHGPGVVSLAPRPDHVQATLQLADLRDLTAAVARCRFLLDLDADPEAIDAHLSHDLEDLVRKAPGRRVPRTVDPQEMALRAVLGQQVSTAAARTHAARLVTAVDERVEDDTLTHLFPTAEQLLDADLRMPTARADTFRRLAHALASGDLDLGGERDDVRRELLALKGIGPWTVEVVMMRALGDPDAWLPTDLGVVQSGVDLSRAERWRPWRAYAVQHLWALGDHPVNTMPGGTP